MLQVNPHVQHYQSIFQMLVEGITKTIVILTCDESKYWIWWHTFNKRLLFVGQLILYCQEDSTLFVTRTQNLKGIKERYEIQVQARTHDEAGISFKCLVWFVKLLKLRKFHNRFSKGIWIYHSKKKKVACTVDSRKRWI